jgi:hypothetical protein
MDVLSEGMEASSESWTSFMESKKKNKAYLYIFNDFVHLFLQRFENLVRDPDADTEKVRIRIRFQ